MAFTKITASGIGSTETVTIDGLSVINDGSFGGNVSVAGTLTYEDVTNIDSVGLITARSGINVGTGITLSPDGDAFFTGISTFGGDIKASGSNIVLGDSGSTSDDRIVLGDGSDLMIYHNGSDSVIREQGTGNLDIQTTGGNVDILVNTTETAAKFISDGAVELYHDNSKKLETTADGIEVSGAIFASGKLDIPDNAKLMLGTSDDLEIFHDGSNSYVRETGTGSLFIEGNSTIYIGKASGGAENGVVYNVDGSVDLYHDNSKKLETTSSGVTVTGAVTDSKGNLRSIPLNNQASAYTLVAADAGKTISSNGGTITVDASVMSSGDAVTLINNSGSNQTITQGSGLTIYNTADAATGNRTLAARGMATIYFFSATVAYISGAGLS